MLIVNSFTVSGAWEQAKIPVEAAQVGLHNAQKQQARLSPILSWGISPIGSVAFDYTLTVKGGAQPSPPAAIFHYGERVMHIFTFLFRLLVFQLGMLCLSLPCYAERAEPVQYQPSRVGRQLHRLPTRNETRILPDGGQAKSLS